MINENYYNFLLSLRFIYNKIDSNNSLKTKLYIIQL